MVCDELVKYIYIYFFPSKQSYEPNYLILQCLQKWDPTHEQHNYYKLHEEIHCLLILVVSLPFKVIVQAS
jgi:hypothetical protein